MRREQPGRDAADRAAGRNPHIEGGEVARRGPPPGQLAVAHQRADEEYDQVDRDDADDRGDRDDDEQDDQAQDKKRLGGGNQPVRDDRAALKGNDEGQQIKRERHHPHQRHRRHVGRDVGGDRDQQPRWHRRQHDPDRGVAPARRRGFRGTGGGCGHGPAACRLRRPLGRSQQQHGAGCDQQDQTIEADRPRPSLVAEPRERLDDKRIGNEREKASGVACGIEEIRILRGRVVGAHEPGLQQRRIGGEREERQPDRNGKQPEQPERLTHVAAAGPIRRQCAAAVRNTRPPSPSDE